MGQTNIESMEPNTETTKGNLSSIKGHIEEILSFYLGGLKRVWLQ